MRFARNCAAATEPCEVDTGTSESRQRGAGRGPSRKRRPSIRPPPWRAPSRASRGARRGGIRAPCSCGWRGGQPVRGRWWRGPRAGRQLIRQPSKTHVAHLSGEEEVGVDAAEHRAARPGADGDRLDRLLGRRLRNLDCGLAAIDSEKLTRVNAEVLLDDRNNVGERHLRRELDDTAHARALEAGRRVLRPVDDLGRALERLNKPVVS